MKKLDQINALLEKYNYAVPRYTSFPPATQFNEDISQKDYVSLLTSLPDEGAVSLYVHIPFCHVMCHYCGCNTKVVNSYSPVESYLELLLAEIELTGKTIGKKLPVNLLHFGGGSPNYLKPTDFKRVVDKLSECFDMDCDAQIDVEVDPRYLDDEMIKCFADTGVKRVSLGVQDFNDEVQKAINRVQPFEKVKKAVENLRAHGINKINFDLMIGLPRQTIQTVSDTAELAVTLSPDRLAVFPYAHVPWMKKHQKLLEKYSMADGLERFLMGEAVAKILNKHDYQTIGIDHYSYATDSLAIAQNEGRLTRNFQGYSTDISEAIISFGHSSISSFKTAYTQNTMDPVAYRKNIMNGEFPVYRGCNLNENDEGVRKLIEELMCNFELNLDDYAQFIGGLYYEDKLRELEKDGLVVLDNMYLMITDTGRPFTRVVASCFDQYFIRQENQHTKVV